MLYLKARVDVDKTPRVIKASEKLQQRCVDVILSFLWIFRQPILFVSALIT